MRDRQIIRSDFGEKQIAARRLSGAGKTAFGHPQEKCKERAESPTPGLACRRAANSGEKSPANAVAHRWHGGAWLSLAEPPDCIGCAGCQRGSLPRSPLEAPPAGCGPMVISYTATFLVNGVAMRFTLLDRVAAIEPGKSITAIKTLSLSEEYLADHFPCFPVMPGVLMLESMTQAAAWAIRLGEDFAHSIVVLREARNVKYGDFVEPGRLLTVTAEIQSQDGPLVKVKASGSVGDRTSLTARL
ncbi:MAG: 3-hydroxyacyl-ACP dehydratase FabZ family protein, partial [Planctomycetia bacterium]